MLPLTDLCMYAIKHSNDLLEGKSDTFHEKKRWASAKRLLDEAKRNKKQVPVIFSPAEETYHLCAWALLEKIDITRNGTSYTFSKLRRFKSPQSP